MKSFNKEKVDILNYLLIKQGKLPVSRMYKIHIKDVGCNAQCPMCDDWKKKGQLQVTSLGLFSVLESIIKEKVKYKMVYIFGGEPLLLFDDLLTIITKGKRNMIEFTFPTNASLLSKERVDTLMRAGLNKFIFSLDFPSEKHNDFRKLKNAYENISELTPYIQSKNGIVQRNTVVGVFNVDELPGFNDLYLFSKPNIHDFIKIEANGGKSEEFFLTDEVLAKAKAILEKLKSEHTEDIDINLHGMEEENHKGSQLCFIPLMGKHFYIQENGSIETSPCYIDNKKYELEISSPEFISKAIMEGCNKCISSHKGNYNHYFLDLIKKYKLSSK